MKKGQESMPIQLLLGATILSFVLAIGFYSYRQVCANQYDQKVEANLNRIARTMEQTYQGGVGTSPPALTIDTSPPAGCDVNFESIRLLRGTEDACVNNVGHEYCLMAVAVASDDQGNRYVSSDVYIDLPEGVTVDWTGTQCGETSIEEIYQSSGSSSNQCKWQSGVFNVKMTKTDKSTIEIRELGAG